MSPREALSLKRASRTNLCCFLCSLSIHSRRPSLSNRCARFTASFALRPGLYLPRCFLGIKTSRTASGLYVPPLNSLVSSPNHRSTPYASMSSAVCPSTPQTPQSLNPLWSFQPLDSLHVLSSFIRPSRSRAPSLSRHLHCYGPIRHPYGPASPSQAAGWPALTTAGASRVAAIALFHTCCRHYPGGTGRCPRCSLPARCQPSPFLSRVGFHIARFEACSTFTCVAARMFAELPLAALLFEVLQPKSLPP